ncbi:MAG: adenosylmethionine decarboxylase [Candidatus Niyogibacteria bacterium]|nr:adenosylmethionine decarboxylase [Candidatus Niyogibacteria bacterium]
MEKMIDLGRSIFATFCGCTQVPDDLIAFEQILKDACRISGAVVRKVGSVGDEFTPQGVTVAAILQESHAVIDTWPEYATLTFDIFTCGDHADPAKAVRYLWEIFHPRKILYIKGEMTEEMSVIERKTILFE